MTNIILEIVGLLIIAIGVISIYDARSLAKKYFSYSNNNNYARILRITGFIISIIGATIIYMW